MDRKAKLLITLILISVVLQFRAYYMRNLKVDDDFLEGIVQIVTLVEEKRVNEINHTWEDSIDIQRFLNHDYMGFNSNLEIDIKGNVQGMSNCLYQYYSEKENGNKDKAIENMEYYITCLNELQFLLTPMREKRPQLEVLWEKGIFKEE